MNLLSNEKATFIVITMDVLCMYLAFGTAENNAAARTYTMRFPNGRHPIHILKIII
jgi:hypothetical protein